MHAESEETLDQHKRRIAFRCSCGADVLLPIGGNGECDTCGRAILLGRMDPSQTISFCSEIGSGTSIHLEDGPDRTGETLGHFQLISKLGYGGMGAVYRALDESLQRFVAVKVIRSSDTQSPQGKKLVQRLLDEAVAQARLNHPNVVTIYYVGREGEEPFFAMELLPGPTLAQKIQHEPLPYEDVIHYARQVSSALAQAHRLGLVHGDIKPSNLVLADDKTVKLSDFGLSKTEGTQPSTGISGTLSYLAPELLQGGAPTLQSDMYSLGVTLFELTFGRRPYALTGKTIAEQISSKNVAEVEFPSKWPDSVPLKFRELLEKLMARDPDSRYRDFAELESDLKAIAPIGLTSASLIIRVLAFIIDYCVIGLGLLPFFYIQDQILFGYLDNSARGLIPLVILVPAIAVFAEQSGRRTLGRWLFQVRMVDKHGLLLEGKRRLWRSVLRYTPAFLLAIGLILTSYNWFVLRVIISPLDELWLLADIIPALGPSHLALHDRLVRSRIVLDTVSGA
ncbi:MAG: protein kinase [Planctomycetota bacterium]